MRRWGDGRLDDHAGVVVGFARHGIVLAAQQYVAFWPERLDMTPPTGAAADHGNQLSVVTPDANGLPGPNPEFLLVVLIDDDGSPFRPGEGITRAVAHGVELL